MQWLFEQDGIGVFDGDIKLVEVRDEEIKL
jgi:hypothetical protein